MPSTGPVSEPILPPILARAWRRAVPSTLQEKDCRDHMRVSMLDRLV